MGDPGVLLLFTIQWRVFEKTDEQVEKHKIKVLLWKPLLNTCVYFNNNWASELPRGLMKTGVNDYW